MARYRRVCKKCRERFVGARSNQIFCSAACRKAAQMRRYRRRQNGASEDAIRAEELGLTFPRGRGRALAAKPLSPSDGPGVPRVGFPAMRVLEVSWAAEKLEGTYRALLDAVIALREDSVDVDYAAMERFEGREPEFSTHEEFQAFLLRDHEDLLSPLALALWAAAIDHERNLREQSGRRG